MKKSEIVSILQEFIKAELTEANTTGTGASFSAGSGEQYATPFAFSKNINNRAVQFLKKMGFKKVERPKRPSSTKLVDYRQ